MGIRKTMKAGLCVALVCTTLAAAAPVQRLTLTLDPAFLAAMANATHYEDPKPNGCRSDELAIQIQGLTGDFCTPECTLFEPCPTDVPATVTAKPQCALQDASTNKKYCALICSPSVDEAALRVGDAQCGTATCKPIQGLGIC